MAKLTGRYVVAINGVRKNTEKGASLNPGGTTYKAVAGASGFCGHEIDEVKPATAKFTMILDENVTLVDLKNLKDTTLVFEGDDGQSYLIRNATVEGDIEGKDGRCEVTMTGAAAEVI